MTSFGSTPAISFRRRRPRGCILRGAASRARTTRRSASFIAFTQFAGLVPAAMATADATASGEEGTNDSSSAPALRTAQSRTAASGCAVASMMIVAAPAAARTPAVGLRTDVRHFGTRRFGPDVKVAVSSPAARGHRWTQKGCGMAVPAEATVPVSADARRSPRVGGWAGWGRIETPADVARLLSAANHAGTPRAGTEQMARLVDTATSVMPGNLDATRVLPVAAELADLLPWPGLVRGAAIAAVGSGSLLLTLLGGAVRDGGWAAVVGLPELGAAAAPESAVELSRLALVPAPGPDWPTVVAALIDGLDLVAVATPAEMAPGMARVLMARARQRGCVLVTTRPWPGCDLILEAVEHRWRGLGHGRGRLRVHEVRLTACGRGAMVRPTTTCVELPLSSPDRRLILRTCLGSTGVTGSGPTGSSQERHREKGSAAQGWGQIQLPDGGVGPKEVGALVPEQVAKNTSWLDVNRLPSLRPRKRTSVTLRTAAALSCSSRRICGISERGTLGSKPPASPSVSTR